MTASLPVLLYHHIYKRKDPIAVSPERFESHCAMLQRRGYKGVSLAEAEEYLLNGKALPRRSVLITFDDGYLDNKENAAPILEAYGHQGVVFSVVGAMADAPRKKLVNLDDPFTADEQGYRVRQEPILTWPEARTMDASGVLALASHSLTHSAVYRSSEFVSLHKPGPKKRTFDSILQPRPYGMPCFKVGPALAERAFLPSENLVALVTSLVPQDRTAADEFFKDETNEARVRDEIYHLPRERWGRMETEAEYETRVREDLARSKEILEANLGREQRSLCWPWGKYDDVSLRIAKEVGYRILYGVSAGANTPGGNPDHVHRFKVRDASSAWLHSRLAIYSRPKVASLYAALKR